MDSGHFALAMERYDITVHQPHPPGYFLYVMLGRLLNYLVRDANTTLVSLSVASSALTVVTVFYLGKELFDAKTGFIAAAFAITSPNLWFHGEVALTYVVEAFFSTLIAFLCWKIYRGEHKYLWLSVIVLGVAGGVRQNTAVFLLPLWLFSARGVPARKVLLSLGLLGLVCLLWFVPMIWMTGGWDAYRNALRELWLFNTGNVSVFNRGWTSFRIFSSALFDFIIYGIGAGVFVLSIAAYSLVRRRGYQSLDMKKVSFFLAWTVPSILFYLFIFIHPANPGYVLIILPALFLLTAASLVRVSDELRKITGKEVLLFGACVVVILNGAIFLFSSYPVSRRGIANHDRDLVIMLERIKSYDSSKTAVFVGPYIFFGYRQIMYYLPDYRVYQVDTRVAPTGDVRKTFWGVNRNTFLSNEIFLPEGIDTFLNPLISDDVDRVRVKGGVNVDKLGNSQIYIASGPISLIKSLYPKLKMNP